MVKYIPQQEILNDDTTIWRYMNFASFYYLLSRKSLFFKRLDKHSDKLEGTLDIETKDEMFLQRLSYDFSTHEESIIWLENEAKNIEGYRERTLSNSWTIGINENYAMWKIYLAGNAEGIAIKTTVKKLMESLANNEIPIFIGKVNYKRLKAKEISQFTVSTNKQSFYDYENELRALILNQFDTLKDEQGKKILTPKHKIGIDVNVDLNILIDKIYISPFAGDWFRQVVESALENLHPNFDRGLWIYQSNIKDA